jgi:cytochrome c oxidase assembly factor CtaG
MTGALAPLLHAWNWDPAIVLGLLYGAAFYAAGTWRLWSRAGPGAGVTYRQASAFAAALLALSAALVSPLDTLAAVLFSAHMIQHLLLVLVAAPMLVCSIPGFVGLWALPRAARRAAGRLGKRLHPVWRNLAWPPVAWSLYVGTLWVWHIPALYSAAVMNPLLHALEHGSFLLAAMLFWWVLLHPLGRSRLAGGAAALYLFTASVQASILGALLTFAPRPLYPAYAAQLPGGLAPLQDQQLAGLLMWIPGGMLFTVLAAVSLGSWLQAGLQAKSVSSGPEKGTETVPESGD